MDSGSGWFEIAEIVLLGFNWQRPKDTVSGWKKPFSPLLPTLKLQKLPSGCTVGLLGKSRGTLLRPIKEGLLLPLRWVYLFILVFTSANLIRNSYYVDPRGQTQVIRLGSSLIY